MASQNYLILFFIEDVPEVCQAMRDESIRSVSRFGHYRTARDITAFLNVCYMMQFQCFCSMLVKRDDPNHLTLQHVALSLLHVFFFLRGGFKFSTHRFSTGC